MTNVKGEHFEFDDVKPMLQNELFNIELFNKEEEEKKIITSKCTPKATVYVHSSVYCFSKKIN